MQSNRLKWLLSDKWQNRIWQHLLFWSLSFGLLLRIFAFENSINKSDLIFTTIFHLSLLVVVYGNLRIGITRLLAKGNIIGYFAFTLVLIVFSAWLNGCSFDFLVDLLFPDYFFISEYNFLEAAGFMVIYLAVSSLLKLSKAWFQVTEAKETMEKLKQEKTQAELSALKSQVNPHFLFNSLNSLYSLSLYQDAKTPELIMRLSNAMRYMLYESNEAKVLLKDEIEYLNNYIELQRLRADDSADTRFEVKGHIDKQKIAPLLLIPFIENGFKHGIKGETSNAFIHILLEAGEETLSLSVKNNKGSIDPVGNNQYKGIGLANVRRRLDLLYKNNYQLDIKDEQETFSVYLNLNLK